MDIDLKIERIFIEDFEGSGKGAKDILKETHYHNTQATKKDIFENLSQASLEYNKSQVFVFSYKKRISGRVMFHEIFGISEIWWDYKKPGTFEIDVTFCLEELVKFIKQTSVDGNKLAIPIEGRSFLYRIYFYVYFGELDFFLLPILEKLKFVFPLITYKTKTGVTTKNNYIEMVHSPNYKANPKIISKVNSILLREYLNKMKNVTPVNIQKTITFKVNDKMEKRGKNRLGKDIEIPQNRLNDTYEIFNSFTKLPYEIYGYFGGTKDSNNNSYSLKNTVINSTFDPHSVMPIMRQGTLFEFHTHPPQEYEFPSIADIKAIHSNNPTKNHFVVTSRGLFLVKYNHTFMIIKNLAKMHNFDITDVFTPLFIPFLIAINDAAVLCSIDDDFKKTDLCPLESNTLWLYLINSTTLSDFIFRYKKKRPKFRGYDEYINSLYIHMKSQEGKKSFYYEKISEVSEILRNELRKVKDPISKKIVSILLDTPAFDIELVNMETLVETGVTAYTYLPD